jgi:hypothetical protein
MSEYCTLATYRRGDSRRRLKYDVEIDSSKAIEELRLTEEWDGVPSVNLLGSRV